MRSLMIKTRLTYIRHYQEFQDLFGVPLAMFWDRLFGFDVVKFDGDFIKPKKGESTGQAIKEKYGARARELCECLIDLDH